MVINIGLLSEKRHLQTQRGSRQYISGASQTAMKAASKHGFCCRAVI